MKRRVQSFLLARPALYTRSRRAFGVARYLARRPHEADFRYFARFAGRDGLFLDVGANSGISALAYRIFDRSSQIVSIEPNPYLERDLRLTRRLIGSDFRYELCAAGDAEGAFDLHVPVHRGIPLTGDASLDRDEALRSWTAQQLGLAPGDLEIARVRVPVRRIDDMGLDPHAVKIDVQGAELATLRGMRETLERCRPVLLIEASEETDEISAWLAPLGYRPFLYDAATDGLTPFAGQPTTNVLFTPDAPAG